MAAQSVQCDVWVMTVPQVVCGDGVQLDGHGKTYSNMWAGVSLYLYLLFSLHFETKSHYVTKAGL